MGMSSSNFKELGKQLALTELGVPVQEQIAYTIDIGDNVERNRLAVNFAKEAACLMPLISPTEEGFFAKVLLEKVASIHPEEMNSDITDFIMEQATELNQLRKQAGLSTGAVAAGAANYIPSLLKGFIALSVLGGAGLGASTWVGKKALEGPDEDRIAELEAGIREYHKLRGRVEREKRNEQIEKEYL
jgi:hypothetical protein